jgi:hypothetical protein
MNITQLIAWFASVYDAKTIVNGKDAAREWRNGAFDTLVQVLLQERPEMPKDEAETWIVEEVNEIFASKG